MNTANNSDLSDIINGIATSLAHGRQMSDVEAMRSALQYQKIPLLEGMSIPRMRFASVKVSLPMIVENIHPKSELEIRSATEIGKEAAKSFSHALKDSISWLEMRAQFYELSPSIDLEEQKILKEYNHFLRNELNGKIISLFQNELSIRLQSEGWIESNLNENQSVSGETLMLWAGESTKSSLLKILEITALGYFQKEDKESGEKKNQQELLDKVALFLNHKVMETLVDRVKLATEKSALRKLETPTRVEVNVDTEQIKNAGGGPDAVTRLTVVMREEGLEWVADSNDSTGEVHKKLMIE